MIGLIIYINYKLIRIEKTFSLDNIDDAKKELINYLSNEINKLHIDFPISINDFEYLWFEHNNMEHLENVFSYNIFDTIDFKWKKIWDIQEIYNDILEKINELDIDNNIYDNNYIIDEYGDID